MCLSEVVWWQRDEEGGASSFVGYRLGLLCSTALHHYRGASRQAHSTSAPSVTTYVRFDLVSLATNHS